MNTADNEKGRSALRDLFETLDARKRPEDVAQMIIEVAGAALDPRELRTLERAARGSIKRRLFGLTSMMEDFARPVGMNKQVRVAELLFQRVSNLSAADCARPDLVEPFVRECCETIAKAFGRSDFKYDRLNRDARKSSGMDISRRRYNKLFRLLGRMEAKLKTLVRELRKLAFTKIGKSSLASRLDWEPFAADVDGACFIAYYTARCNLRSEFTIAGQTRPFDEIAEMLLSRCRRNGSANWWAIAHVFPEQDVLARLSDENKGALLGRWHGVLEDVADLLREIWEATDVDETTMIVQQGNDSTTWNNTANAWNRARESWLALVHAMGMDDILDHMCPGKVMRLMAADVAAWHRVAGNGLDPDTAVWATLPRPWDVLGGTASCTRHDIERVCRRRGVDARKRGWIAPQAARQAVAYRPTPELVHGVTISSPRLAARLRKAGWFSGKDAAPVSVAVEVDRDEHGFARGARRGGLLGWLMKS